MTSALMAGCDAGNPAAPEEDVAVQAEVLPDSDAGAYIAYWTQAVRLDAATLGIVAGRSDVGTTTTFQLTTTGNGPVSEWTPLVTTNVRYRVRHSFDGQAYYDDKSMSTSGGRGEWVYRESNTPVTDPYTWPAFDCGMATRYGYVRGTSEHAAAWDVAIRGMVETDQPVYHTFEAKGADADQQACPIGTKVVDEPDPNGGGMPGGSDGSGEGGTCYFLVYYWKDNGQQIGAPILLYCESR